MALAEPLRLSELELTHCKEVARSANASLLTYQLTLTHQQGYVSAAVSVEILNHVFQCRPQLSKFWKVKNRPHLSPHRR